MAIDSPSPVVASARSARERRARRLALLVLILAALAVRGRFMLSRGDTLDRDTDAYGQLAWNVYDEGMFGTWQIDRRLPRSTTVLRQFARGYSWNFQPTAYRPPLYPLALAPFNFLPEPRAGIALFHVLLGAGTVVAVYQLAELCGLSTRGALLAAGLTVIDPLLMHMSVQLMNETLAAFLAMWTLVALARLANRPSVGRGVLAGALAGLCVLCRPTFLVWLACVALALPLCAQSERRRRLVATAVFLLAAAVTIAPWPARNWRQFGVPIVTTTHGGYTLLLANNPSFYDYLRYDEWGSVWDADDFHGEWASETEKIRSLDPTASRTQLELVNDRTAYEQAFANIAAEPGMFLYSCLVRVGRLWSVLPHQLTAGESTSRRGMRYAVAIWYTAELALAAFGLWQLGRKLLATPWIWGVLLLVSFTAVHAFYWTDMRMRAPLVGVIAVLTAQAVVVLASRSRAAKPLAEPA